MNAHKLSTSTNTSTSPIHTICLYQKQKIPSYVFIKNVAGYFLEMVLVANGIAFTSLLPATTAHATNSNIDAVTIYQGMASVTRSLPVAASGEQVLVFSCLSPRLDKDSLSVQAGQGVNVGEVSIRSLSGEQAQQCQYQGNQAVQSQQATLAGIEAQLHAAQTALAYLQNTGKVQSLSLPDSIASSAAQIESQATSLHQRIYELKRQQAAAKDALEQSLAGSSGSTQSSVTQVSVRVASRTASLLKLHYQVTGASWQPIYQAQLDTQRQQMSLQASAIVAQTTGENWASIPLTLSTVRPSRVTNSPIPQVPTLSLYDPQQYAGTSRKAMLMAEPVMAAAPIAYESSDGAAVVDEPLPSFSVSSSNTAGITEYRLPQRVSIASDGRRVTTVLDTQTGNSEVWLRSTPEQELAAYWYASAEFVTGEWADGQLQLYRDGNYIGRSQFNQQRIREQGIGFGLDRNLEVKQLVDTWTESKSGVINKRKSIDYERRYAFTNQHTMPVRLQVLGTEPIVANTDITASVTHTPEVSSRDWNDIQGAIEWQLTLPAKQTQTVQSVGQISYPADKELSR